VSYCINPQCNQRFNLDANDICQNCGTSLLIKDRFRLTKPLRPIDQPSDREVFEAKDCHSNANYILKIIKPVDLVWNKTAHLKLVENLQREKAILQNFWVEVDGEPSIPRCDIDGYFIFHIENHELHCLIIEKIEGESLEEWLKANGPIPEQLALTWLEHMVKILDQVHQNRFIHRDIKPSNIIVRPNGHLVLIDFGFVRNISLTYLVKVGQGLTSGGYGDEYDTTRIRSIGYSPAEQWEGKSLPQSDFFALARTFVYLCTGIEPYELPQGDNLKLQWRDRAPQISSSLADCIDWLMEPEPGKRPQNTQVILGYLSKGLNSAKSPKLWNWWNLWRIILFPAVSLVVGTVILINRPVDKSALATQANRDGDTARINGNLLLAQEHYQQALEHKPKDPQALTNLGVLCNEERDYRCAIAYFQKALSDQPDFWPTYAAYGLMYDDQQQFDLAIHYYKKAIALSQQRDAESRNNLARILILQATRTGSITKLREAEQQIQQGLSHSTDPITRSSLYKNLGWVYLYRRDFQQANKFLSTSVQLESSQVAAYCLLGKLNDQTGNQRLAQQHWQKCLEIPSTIPEVRSWQIEKVNRLLSTSYEKTVGANSSNGNKYIQFVRSP
jgi:serine/threonine protein kinase/predicted negative regulator of RcsB-dependent stress response